MDPIELTPKGEIDCKRFYTPSFIWKCPGCGEPIEWNDYLSDPDMNEPFEAALYCYECDSEWKVEWKVDVTIHLKPVLASDGTWIEFS